MGFTRSLITLYLYFVFAKSQLITVFNEYFLDELIDTDQHKRLTSFKNSACTFPLQCLEKRLTLSKLLGETVQI
jgi:hypothetical protein